MKQQVFGGIAADGQFGKDHEVRLQVVVRTLAVIENPGRVPFDVANDEIELGQRNGDPVSHQNLLSATAGNAVNRP